MGGEGEGKRKGCEWVWLEEGSEWVWVEEGSEGRGWRREVIEWVWMEEGSEWVWIEEGSEFCRKAISRVHRPYCLVLIHNLEIPTGSSEKRLHI